MATANVTRREKKHDPLDDLRLKKPFPWVWAVLIAIPVILCAVYYALCGSTAMCDSISASFSTPARLLAGKLSGALFGRSYTPPSMTEILYTLLGVFVLAFLIRSIVLIVRGRGERLALLGKRVLTLALVAAYIWTGLCWLWNVEYNCTTFAQQSGMEVGAVSAEDLKATAAYFAEEANRLSYKVERDSELHYSESLDSAFTLTGLYNDALLDEFPALSGYDAPRPKAMFYSRIMSELGYTGIYLPFTGEANINTLSPRCLTPFTVAHEMAHQRGVAIEAEANFVGIAACIYSENDVYAYSGCLLAMMELMDALYSADVNAWKEVSYTLCDNVRQDWADNNDYWNSMESGVTKVANTIYDGYLKSSGQELGIRSYGACVDLLVAWYLK